ncbi:DNA polymerase I [Mucilaginibacter rubeus]|uniref:DNA polymerase I n=1 Tax=Mucilaginibacter rubeus TaxID=2027860 RepID=A0AAE6JL22_9SPHI|nr:MULTISPECIES: DNA polymerase I [Mucilaginibacter]QEM07303.1 DNA polymerase I [Mucilaginibacter rubeus]QEM19756.1 DNA polymerase I [Mucilaginibacter gossypii]QTE43540.1 DNA polymerase I [Mucilaginibacter rubeus]QTE50140.1 DNA polymerase I [Mucilaginibacter rubeus]QTE55229.1 DNA polymerase I [Mucilaginibacter rubeus]
MKKLFLLDGMALIYRAHFALSKTPRFTSNGLNTSAMMGFTNTLLDVLKKEAPTHMAVVFDTEAPTERHTDFEGYKAHREAMPEDLAKALPYVIKIILGFNIPVITSDGYEADDIIGTLAKKAEQKGYTVYCMTPDKDFGQLVSDNIFIYKPARMGNEMEIQGVKEILAKWEIERVDQVIDILGLWGDAVDGIPGIPGIGEKTAKALIKQYGSMENIFEHSHELKGKQRENVEQFKEQGLMSKKLATILLNVPVELDEEGLEVCAPSKELLEPLFAELEFRTLGKRVFGDDFSITEMKPAGTQIDLFGNPTATGRTTMTVDVEDIREDLIIAAKNINNTPHEYHLADTVEKRAELIKILAQQPTICFDTETTGTDPNHCELVGLSFSVKPGQGWYVPVPADQAGAKSIVTEFKAVLENENIGKIGQNIKFDILMLKWYNIEVKGTLFDTMLAHYILDPDTRHNMDILSENYLGYKPVSITELIGPKGKNQGNMRDVDFEKIKEYAAEDADITLQLKDIFEPKLKEVEGEKLVNEIEHPLIYVLADMEYEGVKIDHDTLREFSKQLETDIAQYEKTVYEKAGVKFNIASPKQLGEVLFEKLMLDPKAKKTKTGQYQTGEDVLLSLAAKSDIVRDILDFRQLQKLKSTYVDALPQMVNPKTGRVHTSYNQAVAATGRLSSVNPNLQNIPIRTERGREVRKAFIPRDSNHTIVSADYSQIELRIIAEISKDPNMMQAFINNHDIHTATAANVYGIGLDEVTSDQRRNAKAVNFGIIYGQSAFGLSQSLGIPRKEAAEIIEQYFVQFAGIKQYMSDTMNFARENGYVCTLMGRRRYLRDINSANATVRGFAERNAINAPIQGSAADMIKIAMINIHKELKAQKLDARMTMQVHDELVFDVPNHEVEIVKPIIMHHMKNAIKTEVPIMVEIGTGLNWLEAH